MRLFIIIIIAIFIGIVIYFLSKDKLNKVNTIILSILSIIIVIAIGIYTSIQDRENRKDADIITSFLRGEEIQCGDLSISQEKFNFINGTLSFVGKKNTDFSGKTISIEQCY